MDDVDQAVARGRGRHDEHVASGRPEEDCMYCHLAGPTAPPPEGTPWLEHIAGKRGA